MAPENAEGEIDNELSCKNSASWDLLKSGEGQCAAWANAIGESLADEGVSSEGIEIFPWQGKSGDPKFPYWASEITDVAALPGTTNPDSDFSLHFVQVQAILRTGKTRSRLGGCWQIQPIPPRRNQHVLACSV